MINSCGYWIGGFLTHCIAFGIQNGYSYPIDQDFHCRFKKGEKIMPFTTMNFDEIQDDVKILKVAVPQNYTEKEMKNINKLVKEQVGDYYIPVVVPNGIELEIIV